MKITKRELKEILKEEIEATIDAGAELKIPVMEGHGAEGSMARSQLGRTAEIAMMLQDMIEDESDLEEWVESKITLAHEYIETVYAHFEGTDKPKVRSGVMGLHMAALPEGKEDCFAKGKYKTFKGKSKCIQRTKDLSQERADAYVASVLRDMGEIE